MHDQNSMAGMNRNYFPDNRDNNDGLKYRLGGEEIVKELVRNFRGAVKDDYGRIIRYDKERSMINDIGAERLGTLLSSQLNKLTHLSKYANEERVFKQAKPVFHVVRRFLTQNRKLYEIKDKDAILSAFESTVFSSMLRGNEGFENNNISKSWNVNENINPVNPQPNQQGGGFITSLFKRGGP